MFLLKKYDAMTTYNVSIPDNKKAFFLEFLELIGAQYQKDDSDFLLTDQQKQVLLEQKHLSLDDCMDADDFLKEMQKKYGL